MTFLRMRTEKPNDVAQRHTANQRHNNDLHWGGSTSQLIVFWKWGPRLSPVCSRSKSVESLLSAAERQQVRKLCEASYGFPLFPSEEEEAEYRVTGGAQGWPAPAGRLKNEPRGLWQLGVKIL